jgi:3-deoxy-D-manno-octulosonate 8-phosphate phosphatase (KDO 8-P phosphatase)
MRKIPKLILTDIDGVWTDGGMYYDQTGNEWKRFSTYDGGGVKKAHDNGIPIGIVTAENTTIVENRAKKLNVDFVFQGVKDKLREVSQFCASQGIDLLDVAYIGDDVGDLDLLKAVGFSAIPIGAYITGHITPSYITKKRGGDGAFRDFVDWIFEREE